MRIRLRGIRLHAHMSAFPYLATMSAKIVFSDITEYDLRLILVFTQYKTRKIINFQ